MGRFGAALSQHPRATEAVGEVAGAVVEQLGGERPDLAVCFASPHHIDAFADVVRALWGVLEPRVLLGGSAISIVGRGREIEETPALSLFTARLPGTRLEPLALRLTHTSEGPAVTGWPTGAVDPAATLLMFADPFSLPVDGLLARLDEEVPGLRVIGGLASAARGPGGNRLALDDTVADEGGVGVLLGGGVDVRTVVSQGCRPIGRPFTVTRAAGNLVQELGGKPALARLQEIAAAASEEDRELLRRGLHVGVVVDERKEEFARGDFLVRNLLGADDTGALAVGDDVEVGRTVQFHVRDAAAADDDLREMLTSEWARGALLFTCNGRGRQLFGTADHDAATVESLLGPIPLAGAFCAGEIGPVGGRNFVHGFTASLMLFRP